MTNDPLDQHMRELSWRKLSPSEVAQLQAWLAAHPEAQADCDTEVGLTEVLERLPQVPVASNFTSRVLAAVERERAASQRRNRRRWQLWPWRLAWLPRVAFVALILGVGLFSYGRVAETHRKQMADSVRTFSEVAAATSPEVLENFEAIQASQTPPPDVELLALFQ